MKAIYSSKKVITSVAKPEVTNNIIFRAEKFDESLTSNLTISLVAHIAHIEDSEVVAGIKVSTLTPMSKTISLEEKRAIYANISLPENFTGDIIDQEEYYFYEAIKYMILNDEGGSLFGVESADLEVIEIDINNVLI